MFRFLIIFLLYLLTVNLASAHQLSTAYANMELNEQGLIKGELQIRLYDLEQSLQVDVDSDGKLRWSELQTQSTAIHEYLVNHLSINRSQQPCGVALSDKWQIDSHFNESYLLIPFRAQCSTDGIITINYSAIFAEDTNHKLLLSLRDNNSVSQRVLDDTQRQLEWSTVEENLWQSFFEFVYQGIVHIAIGLDHVLFLISLLLVSPLYYRNKKWLPEENTRQVIANTVWLVTAFTLAHSITLSATALGVIPLSSRWVEVIIAVSVLFVAINTLFPMITRLTWLTFCFGLIHGIGFASVLMELGLSEKQQLLSVVGFNLGVELGQLCLVILLLPILIMIRHKQWYQTIFVKGFSTIIAMIALVWVFERLGFNFL
jgi:HupE / UreJ protein